MKRVQYSKSATWYSATSRKHSDKAKSVKKCKEKMHYSAQTDSGPFVNKSLYTAKRYCFFYFCNTALATYTCTKNEVFH